MPVDPQPTNTPRADPALDNTKLPGSTLVDAPDGDPKVPADTRSADAGIVKDLNAEALDQLIAQGGDTLVQIWASWCVPCKAMTPIVETLAQSRHDLDVVRLEMGNAGSPQNDDWTGQFGVRSVPTFILFRHGKDIGGFAGTAELGQFSAWLDEKLSR